jgi:hypothetical protein
MNAYEANAFRNPAPYFEIRATPADMESPIQSLRMKLQERDPPEWGRPQLPGAQLDWYRIELLRERSQWFNATDGNNHDDLWITALKDHAFICTTSE